MQEEHYVLNLKYRPDTLEGYVCEPMLKSKATKWIEEKNIPNLGLWGRPGSGKTTLAKILVKNIDCDYIYLNAADKRSLDDIRNEVLPFVSTVSFKDAPKIVILDEVTNTLQASQILLLNLIESYSLNTRFILTGNYPERLIEPLRSRLEEYNLAPPDKKVVGKHVVSILQKENIKYEPADIVSIINNNYPDIRKIINTCQKHILNSVLTVNTVLQSSQDFENTVIECLKTPTKSTFNDIRKLIGTHDISDFESMYKQLYENMNVYSKNNDGAVIIILNESLKDNMLVLDKEINFCAAIAKILETIKPRVI